MLEPLVGEAPSAMTARELLGLVDYRLGRWRDAVRQLEAYRAGTGAVDRHAVLADCYRALRRHEKVAEVWDELRRASPAAEIVAEGRIVAAGSLADQGDIQGAIRLLERAGSPRQRPKEHHLRTWYALADLYERAGDIPRARELFARLARHDPGSFDTVERLVALR
jgi:tetratricopeptide (TPR) repeat protein